MPKLNISNIEIEYDAIDCKDKVIIFKIPDDLFKGIMYINTITKLHEYFKESGAKKVICIRSDVNFESMGIDDAIYKINDYIDQLSRIKEDLLEMDDV